MVRILVYEPLSAHSGPADPELRAAGRAMRDAMAADLAAVPGVMVTVGMDEQEAGQALRRLAPRFDRCWIVAPESGGLLLRLREVVGDPRWIGCSGPAIRLASSKRATCAALAASGVLTPGHFAPSHEGAWIVKPDDGAGSMDTRQHATRAAAEADLRSRPGQAVLEPFVDGEALSVSLIVGPVLAEVVAFNRQQIHIDAAGCLHDRGVLAAALPPHDPRVGALQAVAWKVVAALPGLRGFVGIDLVWDEGGRPVVIEVNPRVTCAYVGLSARLRRNLAADVLEATSHVCA